MTRVVTLKELRARVEADPSKGGGFAGQIPIGFWTATKETTPERGRIWPGTVVDLTWAGPERDKVIAYLKESHGWKMGYMGCSYCRLCKEAHPPHEYKSGDVLPDWAALGTHDFGDGTYVWPEGYVHYLVEHAVKPPQEFITHVLSGGSKL